MRVSTSAAAVSATSQRCAALFPRLLPVALPACPPRGDLVVLVLVVVLVVALVLVVVRFLFSLVKTQHTTHHFTSRIIPCARYASLHTRHTGRWRACQLRKSWACGWSATSR